MPGNAIFLSVRSQYASKIFEGSKTVELRRVRPRYIARGALVLIYVPSPVKSLVGAFKVDQVVEKPLEELWETVHDRAGVTREEFDAYYDGVSIGIAIFFRQVWSLPAPIELEDLKERMVGFHPPQGFRYATASELASPDLARLVEDTEIAVQRSFLGRQN
ncbi:MAG: ASCH domain-containing protein [Anaerolineae bacterium]|nr:ASCH domain-containing protein [Anaerolineae bacterium]